jgi:site-specific recombinase XerD
LRVQRLRVPDGEVSWTVLGEDWLPAAPVEEFLEYLRAQRRSPNTVRNYAQGLARWWEFLGLEDAGWEAVSVEQLAGFLVWLRSGETSSVVSLVAPPRRLSEATVALRLAAVMAFYRYHQLNGVPGAGRLYERVQRGGGAYKPFLEHLARRSGHRRAVVAVRRRRRGMAPILTPSQMVAIKDACAHWDQQRRRWAGSLRHRLVWSVAEETGMRIAEVLSLQHRDWHTGRGDTPFVEIVPREHPHGLRVKGGAYRKLYVSDELDRLYGEYLVELCERGADIAVEDLDAAYVFVNLEREPRFSPMRVESVYALVGRLRRELAGVVPVAWTPHWFRHSHATALLLGGVPLHVVSRRLGHVDVQTTQNIYAWVTEDAELRAVADWKALSARWPVA